MVSGTANTVVRHPLLQPTGYIRQHIYRSDLGDLHWDTDCPSLALLTTTAAGQKILLGVYLYIYFYINLYLNYSCSTGQKIQCYVPIPPLNSGPGYRLLHHISLTRDKVRIKRGVWHRTGLDSVSLYIVTLHSFNYTQREHIHHRHALCYISGLACSRMYSFQILKNIFSFPEYNPF